MFVANSLTIWIEALKMMFDSDQMEEDLRGIPILPEYPIAQVNYPGIWVNFTTQGDLMNVGIDHVEYAERPNGRKEQVYRWKFAGVVEMTVGAMGNLERARLVDEITRNFAIARVGQNHQGDFRQHIEQNDLIGMAVSWESFSVGAFGEIQGTPWETDDVIYEATISISVEGEVVVWPDTGELVPLSKVIVEATEDPTSLPEVVDRRPVVGEWV